MAFGAVSDVSAAGLTIEITGIRNGDGQIRYALHDDPGAFPEGERFKGHEEPARPGTVIVTFSDIPPGRYALAVHHDENTDEEMNTNFIGWPREGFGFSRDARVILTAPTFEAAAFDVPESGAKITLRMRY